MNFLWFIFLKKKVANDIYQRGFADGKKSMSLHVERLKNEMNNQRQRHIIEIERLHGEYSQELYRVRESEKELWQNILDEKNFELNQSVKREQERTKVYEVIKNIGIELEKRAESVSDKFNRGIEKVADGFKLIESANGEIKHFNRIIQERDPKVTKLLSNK